MMCMFELNEEPRKNQERRDEKVPKNASVFDIEYRSAQQSKSLRNKTHQ